MRRLYNSAPLPAIEDVHVEDVHISEDDSEDDSEEEEEKKDISFQPTALRTPPVSCQARPAVHPNPRPVLKAIRKAEKVEQPLQTPTPAHPLQAPSPAACAEVLKAAALC